MKNLVSLIRRMLPGIALRTTCMTGFPGETEAHFMDMLKFIEWARFEHLGVFAYSREYGTRAAELPGRVLARVARERRRVLLETQSRIMDQLAAARSGAVEEALLERPLPGAWAARSFREAPEVDGFIRVRGAARRPDLRAGCFVRVRIKSAKGSCAAAELL